MSGISTKAANVLQNRYKFNSGNEFQSAEFSDFSGLETYDAVNRMYDPQIGRFWQIDELADAYENTSPFAYAENNPILKNDPLGLEPETSTEDNPKQLQEIVIISTRKMSYWAKMNLMYDLQQRTGGNFNRIESPHLREEMLRLQRHYNFRQRVADMTRAGDQIVAETGLLLAPGGQYAQLIKLRKLQYLIRFYNSKRGRFAINSLIQFGINGKEADMADVLMGSSKIPGLKQIGFQAAVNWKPFGENGMMPQVAFINKDASEVGIDVFTSLAFYGLGKLPVTSTPL